MIHMNDDSYVCHIYIFMINMYDDSYDSYVCHIYYLLMRIYYINPFVGLSTGCQYAYNSSKLIIDVCLSPDLVFLLIFEFLSVRLATLPYGLDSNITKLLVNLLTKTYICILLFCQFYLVILFQ